MPKPMIKNTQCVSKENPTTKRGKLDYSLISSSTILIDSKSKSKSKSNAKANAKLTLLTYFTYEYLLYLPTFSTYQNVQELVL
jgi:hypothetical protein